MCVCVCARICISDVHAVGGCVDLYVGVYDFVCECTNVLVLCIVQQINWICLFRKTKKKKKISIIASIKFKASLKLSNLLLSITC